MTARGHAGTSLVAGLLQVQGEEIAAGPHAVLKAMGMRRRPPNSTRDVRDAWKHCAKCEYTAEYKHFEEIAR